MVYILIIFVVVGISLGWRFSAYRRTKKIHQLCEKHIYKIRALLDSSIINEESLSDIQKNTILAIESYIWEDWDAHLHTANSLLTDYPIALLEYFTQNYPKPNGYNVKNLRIDIIRLTYNQLKLLTQEDSAYWKERTAIITEAISIEQQYPQGTKAFLDSIGKSATPDMIVVDKDTIAYYQMCCNMESTHDTWHTKQRDFNNNYYETCKKIAPTDGRYIYEVQYQHLTSQGSQTTSSIQIWVGFSFSFSSCLTDSQSENWIKQYKKIPEFKYYNRWFVESVYDKIYKIVREIKEDSECSLLVIFIREGDYNWTLSEYQRHYKNLTEKLKENDVPFAYFDDLLNMDGYTCYDKVFIVDMISNPNSIKSNVEQIINKFNSNPPLLSYYSLIKEMSKGEMEQIISNEQKKQNNLKQRYITYIKDCYTKVIKHPYFSFVAILNTFIGEAHGAELTKSKWLESPSRYSVKIETSDQLFITYTIDGVSKELIMPYKDKSMDECVMATYELFKNMNLLDRFMENGDSVVEFMNERAWLQHH